MKIKKNFVFNKSSLFFVSHRINIFFKSKEKSYNFFLVSGRASSNKMEKFAKEKLENLKLKIKF